MRHRKKGRKLNRTWEHRKAMFKNMAQSLIEHERIKTTLPKAKELRRVVEKLVSLALQNNLHARRQAFKILENHQLVKKLFDEIGPRFVGVQGGYTRVVKLALPRKGDAARLAIIEFTKIMSSESSNETEKDKTLSSKSISEDKTSSPEVDSKSTEKSTTEQKVEVKQETESQEAVEQKTGEEKGEEEQKEEPVVEEEKETQTEAKSEETR